MSVCVCSLKKALYLVSVRDGVVLFLFCLSACDEG